MALFRNDRLRSTRLEFGLSQEEAARQLGIPVRTYRRLDSGEVNKRDGGFKLDHARTHDTVQRICREWGLELSDLVETEHTAPLDATAVAKARGATWVGIEHMAEALASAPIPADPAQARLRSSLPAAGDPTWARFTRGWRHRDASRLEPSPRVAAGATDLASHPGVRLLVGGIRPLDDSDDATWDATAAQPASHPPEDRTPASGTYEVLWGPLDGHTGHLEPGDAVGRAHPEHPGGLALYADTASVDQRLGRRALTWHGDGTLELHRPATVIIGFAARSALGRMTVPTGTIVQLTHATWLLLR